MTLSTMTSTVVRMSPSCLAPKGPQPSVALKTSVAEGKGNQRARGWLKVLVGVCCAGCGLPADFRKTGCGAPHWSQRPTLTLPVAGSGNGEGTREAAGESDVASRFNWGRP